MDPDRSPRRLPIILWLAAVLAICLGIGGWIPLQINGEDTFAVLFLGLGGTLAGFGAYLTWFKYRKPRVPELNSELDRRFSG